MALNDSLCAGNKLIVRNLVFVRPLSIIRIARLALLENNSTAGKGVGDHIVNLVKGEPILHLIAIASEDGLAVANIEIDKVARCPTVIFLGEMPG